MQELTRLLEMFEWPIGDPVPASLRLDEDGFLPERTGTNLPERNMHPQVDNNNDFKDRAIVALRKLLVIIHSTCFGRPLVALEAPTAPMQKYMDELLWLLKLSNSLPEPIEIAENWHLGTQYGQDFVFSGTIFATFQHEACMRPVDFIHTTVSRVPIEIQQRLRDNLKQQMSRIFNNSYLLHFLSKVENLGYHSEDEITDFYTVQGPPTRRPSFWIQEKLVKIQNILLSSGFCSRCVVRLDSIDDILAHLKAKHPAFIYGDYAVEATNRRAKKIKEKERQRCRNIHHTNHEDCINCDFDSGSDQEL